MTNTMETRVRISDAEWSVMRVIWTQGQATSQDIVDILAERLNWKAATIKTLLNRLVKKNILSTAKEGKKFIYTPNVSEKETVRSATATLFSRICSRKIGNTIAEMIEEAQLTTADIELLFESLREKEPVKTIACDCIPGQCECRDHIVS